MNACDNTLTASERNVPLSDGESVRVLDAPSSVTANIATHDAPNDVMDDAELALRSGMPPGRSDSAERQTLRDRLVKLIARHESRKQTAYAERAEATEMAAE